MKKYIDLIKSSKEILDDIKAHFIAKKNEKQLEMEILKIEEQIADRELKVQSAKSDKEVVWNKVGEAIDDLELLRRRLKQFQALKEELF